MNRTIEKVREYIKKNNLIEQNDTIIIGVSGGADSVCLFTILNELKKEYNLTLKVVHINHMIREDAMDDANYVKKLCEDNNIFYKLVCKDVNKLAKDNHLSSEEMGRLIRYNSFIELVDNTNTKIAIAHNTNDTSETFLLNLFRGAGLNGLCSIKCNSEYKDVPIIRPILCLSRQEIEEFLNKQNIEYKIDSTNLECEYTRNKIRNVVLPYVEQNINNKATSNIANAVTFLNEANDFIYDYLANKSKEYIKELQFNTGNVYLIPLNLLLKEHILIQKMLIKEMISKFIVGCKDVSMKNLNDILDICNKDGLKKINLNNNIIVIKELGCLRVKNINTIERYEKKLNSLFYQDEFYCEFDNRTYSIKNKEFKKNHNSYNKQYIPINLNYSNLLLKSFDDNDYIVLNNKKFKIRTYFNEHKIPYNSTYLALNNEVIWVFGQEQLNNNFYVKEDNCYEISFK